MKNKEIMKLKNEIKDLEDLAKFKTETIRELREQLQVKEQECEELKAKLIKWLGKESLRQSEKEFYEQQLDQLKVENEQLQKEREKAKNYNLEYGQLLIKSTNENNKLKRILTEIKEIAETACCNQATTTCEEYKICEECGRKSDAEVVKQALQKINEVEDEKNM